MSETKAQKFVRLRDQRVPKITHALTLLENLGGSAYESSDAERRAVVEELRAAVDSVEAAFKVTPPPEPPKPEPAPPTDGDARPTDIAEGGSTARSEIRWAYDAIRRGDKALAQNRLRRVIDMWP